MPYAYQATVTVPAPTGGPHTDFTLMIRGSDVKLRLASLLTGGAIINSTTRSYTGLTQTVPADCILSTDAAGTSVMTWGIDYWDSTNGTIWMRVKIPSYSAGFTIYVSIGNSLVTGYQGGAIGSEFDSLTRSCYGYPNGSTLSVADFTNIMPGTNTASTATSGPTNLDGAIAFNGTSATVNNGSAAAMSSKTGLTVSCFLKQTSLLVSRRIMGVWDGGETRYLASMDDTTPGAIIVAASDGTNFQIDHTSSAVLTANTSAHFDWTWAGGGNNIIYINGSSVSLTNNAASHPATLGTITKNEFVATAGASSNFLNGSIDELIISSTVRSSAWISTLYANQSNPPVMSAFAPIVSGGGSGLLLMGAGS